MEKELVGPSLTVTVPVKTTQPPREINTNINREQPFCLWPSSWNLQVLTFSRFSEISLKTSELDCDRRELQSAIWGKPQDLPFKRNKIQRLYF